MKFDNKEDFYWFIKKSLEDGDFDSQIKRIAQDNEKISKPKPSKNWDWMEFGKTYLVTNQANNSYFIYYGNQEGSFMWVSLDYDRKWNQDSKVWKMNSNDGECWVMSYLELKLGDNFFLNWDREPWRNLK
ncbi:MAG: hypothetical protein HOC18_04440 [Candidatus Marinimicrobia bacterium]|jgi:hypothetical protein|nr:hypothetical protein [Candidatus Neomarinimicrobiota bacterium]